MMGHMDWNVEPYTMQIKDAAQHFGYHPKSLYAMIYSGELLFGIQYLKVGGKVLIKTKEFKQWMNEKSGLGYGGN